MQQLFSRIKNLKLVVPRLPSTSDITNFLRKPSRIEFIGISAVALLGFYLYSNRKRKHVHTICSDIHSQIMKKMQKLNTNTLEGYPKDILVDSICVELDEKKRKACKNLLTNYYDDFLKGAYEDRPVKLSYPKVREVYKASK